MDAWSGPALSEFILEIHAEPERDPVDEIEISRDRGGRMNPLVGETSLPQTVDMLFADRSGTHRQADRVVDQHTLAR